MKSFGTWLADTFLGLPDVGGGAAGSQNASESVGVGIEMLGYGATLSTGIDAINGATNNAMHDLDKAVEITSGAAKERARRIRETGRTMLEDGRIIKVVGETIFLHGAGRVPTKIIDKVTARKLIANGCSFHGSTLVLTKDGYQAITGIEAVDTMVWAKDELTGQMGWKTVTTIMQNAYDHAVYITIRDVETGDEQTLIANKIHPFFVQTAPASGPQEAAATQSSEGHVYKGPIPNGAWIDSGDLKPGHRLLNPDNTWAEVVSVEMRDEALTAYNLSVDGFHTYFVAGDEDADAVWVHNSDCLGKSWRPRDPSNSINWNGCEKCAAQIQKHLGGGEIVSITPIDGAPTLGDIEDPTQVGLIIRL
ncbi:polymorphic toxin-type HINT domain-containing protein [Halovulum sp. GXIMD14793]